MSGSNSANAAVLEWLLDGDPSITWQVQRDLLGADAAEVERGRRRALDSGWGSELLSLQAPDGSWGGGLYGPKWTSTFYTLLLLTAMGVDGSHPGARKGSRLLLDTGLCDDGGLRYWAGATLGRLPRGEEAELCVTGMGLRIIAGCLDTPQDAAPLVRCLVAAQIEDGGWNCKRSSRHGSFHTTIAALEGLREWTSAVGNSREVDEAAALGREFFLAHQMFKSHRTGEVVKASFTRFTFPHHWHYDVLRGLDYFQWVDAPKDERLQDAIELLLARRKPDGWWLTQNRHPGHDHFVLEPNGGPSRWNTLRALRVLRWWEGRRA